MPESRSKAYEPKDQLWLWWLGDPARARLIGRISLASGGRGVALQYAPVWLASGFALSEDLPLVGDLFLPREKDEACGAVDDARPDRWGERVIRKFEPTPRLSLLEFLLFSGDDRYGALGVSQQADAYAPWRYQALPNFEDLGAMAEAVRKVLANEAVPEKLRRLVRPGASMGGARPKSLMRIDGQAWIVKFAEGEDIDTPLIEHASMTLAAKLGLQVAPTRAVKVLDGHAVAVQRFDRIGSARVHAVSARVALRAAGEDMGYPNLAQLLRRLAPAKLIAQQQEELFKRMVFNVLIDNTDDHEKNHALLRQLDGSYLLSPAYDVVPSAQGLGQQQMILGDQGAESSLANALSQARQFGLDAKKARAIVQTLCKGVQGWQAHLRNIGVRARDIAQLAQYIDGERLRTQRETFAKGLVGAVKGR